jgi:hypothetical protein
MAFSSDTKILTNSGWKLIGDVSGRDRILVRNFIGDSEFLQPFAIRKRHYEGEIVHFGSTYWAVSLTPDHKVVYDTVPDGVKATQSVVDARDVTVDKHKFLYRKFRYIREDKTNDSITVGKRRASLSDEDWYTIIAYTVTKGYISKDDNPLLKYFVDMSEVFPLISILDQKGITYSYDQSLKVLIVNRDSNLARKLKKFLGARKRREMYLPDKIIYGSSQALMKHLLGTITTLVAKPPQNRPNQLMFTSTNRRLLDSLRMLCMFCGYGFSMSENHGEYIVYIVPGKVSPWSVRFLEKQLYSGYVYEIGLFDGLVYVTEKNLPVWMSPK